MHRHRLLIAVAFIVICMLFASASALAVIPVGQPANPFTKNELVGTSTGPAVSLSSYSSQVKILFVLGWS